MPEALVYTERVNALNGESGSGKSWVAMLTAVEVMRAGGHVIYIDLEDHPTSVVSRLRALGADDEQILNNLAYIQPGAAFSGPAKECLVNLIAERRTALVVIDSIGELMALEGCKPNDDDAVASLYRRIPRMLAKLGPAVLLIDHVPKDNTTSPLYGIGSQRKRAAIDGASYMVEQVKAFSTNRAGLVKLTTAKDRNGNFATGHVAALVDVEPIEGERIKLTVRPPEKPSMTASGRFRPTVVMERASRWLELAPGNEASYNVIKEALRGIKGPVLKAALEVLTEEHYTAFRMEGQRHYYSSVTPFREKLQNTPTDVNEIDVDATF